MRKITNKDLQHAERWDPSLPAFLTTVWRTLAVVAVLVSLVGTLIVPAAWSGLVSGSALALALYLVAVTAGRNALATGRYNRVMVALLGQQALLWIGMAVLLAVVRVHPVDFVLGVSTLPIAIIVARIWYGLRKT